MAKTDNKTKKVAVSRYGWLVFLLSFVFIAIIVKAINIKYVEGDMWRIVGKRETTKGNRDIIPNRGSIFADDGRLLATSEPLYTVYIDFLADGIKKDTLMKYVTPLSQALAKKFPDRNAAQYKKVILDGWALSRKDSAEIAKVKKEVKEGKPQRRITARSRNIRLIRHDINYVDLKELRTFPYLNQRSNRSGLKTEERYVRLKPFGNLAGRTVGSIYKEFEKGGASGVELKYNTELQGEKGTKSRQRVQGRWIDIVEIEAQDGLDIKTTLNVDIQDITEKALYSKLVETNAESGCAIIMETATGEIKAISNLDRISEGVYAERNPNIFSYMSEPGSTFKTVSLMVALEDGVVTPQDSFYVGKGVFTYKGKNVNDHDYRKGIEKGYVTVEKGMHSSLNTVISKMILKGYEDNPRKYVEHIHRLGITKKLEWDVPLKGKEGTSVIRFPDDKTNHWSKTTLPWMSFGYETQIPPIYMLMFYNGIANNGKMIKPFLTKAFTRDGTIVQEFTAEVVNPMLCSEHTLHQVQEILRGVVTDGTGKAVNSELVPIAGKTGTAMVATGGGYSGYYVSFCGYFPAENPQYTCFVGIRRPQGIPSGGLMPGAVFKNIAEGVYMRNMVSTPVSAPKDTVYALTPRIKNGMYRNTELVLNKLQQPFTASSATSEWVSASLASNGIALHPSNTGNGVPNVLGMGARDAVYLLENKGLKVNLQGSGKVVEQSIPGGSNLVRGSLVTIRLE